MLIITLHVGATIESAKLAFLLVVGGGGGGGAGEGKG